MTKICAMAAIGLFLLSGCKKSEAKSDMLTEKVTADKDTDTETFDDGKVYNYSALNGVNAEVTFVNNADYNTISIKTEANKFVLDHQDGDEFVQIYERNGVEARLTKDSIIIKQGEKTIPLALKK